MIYKASGSLNTKGHVSFGAGIGYRFDNIDSRSKEILKLQRNGNINLLDERVYEIYIELKELKGKFNELENLIKAMFKK